LAFDSIEESKRRKKTDSVIQTIVLSSSIGKRGYLGEGELNHSAVGSIH
jgi:hypothetical protein